MQGEALASKNQTWKNVREHKMYVIDTRCPQYLTRTMRCMLIYWLIIFTHQEKLNLHIIRVIMHLVSNTYYNYGMMDTWFSSVLAEA